MARLVKTALMITLSPGSVRTMSDALRAASVESATAIPMSAFFRAGASFTPSPVIPHMCFLSCNLLTISYLCSEEKFNMSSKIGKDLKNTALYVIVAGITGKDTSKAIRFLDELIYGKSSNCFIFVLSKQR